MEASRDKSVRRFVRWLRDKVENRRGRDGEHDPWWVTLLLDVGRPVVAVMILTMCAPGEHYLAVQAGWSDQLAWGMPGTLTAYAGIASVVATKRPKNAPGRKTAITGAVVSIALAMAAQPIAHLYGRTGLTAQQVALTVAAGLVPAAVFGHLLHMGAAAPKTVPSRTGRTGRDRAPKQVRTGPVVPPRPAPVPGLSPDPVPPGRDDLQPRRDLTDLVRDLRTEELDEEDIKGRVRDEIPDVKADSLRKALRRTRTA